MVGKKKIRSFPITQLLPNIITLGGLCAGLSAMRYAMLGRWEVAVGLLILAAIIDGMDGRVARMLNATSTFGAELDSLADFVSFGIAPVMVIYMWQLHNIRGLGWIIVLFFAVCCALRLARFNTQIFEDSDEQEKAKADKYFSGVPAPAGAMLCLLPLALHFQFGSGITNDPLICAIYTPIIALLMASTIPTFSAKKYKIPQPAVLPFMVLSGLWLAGMIIETWLTFILSAVLYLIMIPVAVMHYRRDDGTEEAD